MSLTRELVAETAERYGEAWANQDVEALLSIFTEDAMYIERPHRAHEGIEQIQEMWENTIVGKQTDVEFKHIAEDLIFDEATMSAVVKWEASFHMCYPDGTPKRERPFRAVWMVTLRFRECEDGQFRVCWFEEFWHPFKTEEEQAKLGKGKGKGKGKTTQGTWTAPGKVSYAGFTKKPVQQNPASRLAAATARAGGMKKSTIVRKYY